MSLREMLPTMDDERVIFETLLAEIERCLAAVDEFRSEQCEPTWLPELAPCRTPEECLPSAAYHASTPH